MEGKISKRELTTLVIGVISLVVLTLGATFAYFQVAVTDTSGTTTITGDIGGTTLGTVTLTGGDTELYLGISPYDMSENKKGTTYYSSTTEGSRETSKGSAGKTTYTATLSGDTTNTVMYACDYEFTVSATGTMVDSSSFGDVQMVFEGDIVRIINLKNTRTVKGTWYGFKESDKERSFNAYLQLTNTNLKQNDLAGTNVSIEIENTKFECYLNDSDKLDGEAYAIYTEDNQTLTFLRSEIPVAVGETYNGESITKVYTGIEDTEYYLDLDTLETNLPWIDIYVPVSDSMISSPIENVVFEDEIRPISTTAWFAAFLNLQSMDIDKLNMSNVTDMSSMFLSTPINNELDLSGWDTSKVQYMNMIFADIFNIGYDLEITGVSNWDTSNVTEMMGPFAGATLDSDIDISNWDFSGLDSLAYIFDSTTLDLDLSDMDVSNITDMTALFRGATIKQDIGISNWDVSNVTDMSKLFAGAVINADLNLETWDVSKVRNMWAMFSGTTINADLGVEDWDVLRVTNMFEMFAQAIINIDLDLSNWNVAGVEDMGCMFNGAVISDGLHLNSWDVSHVTSMSYMFAGSTIKGNVYLATWPLSSNSDMSYMFYAATIDSNVDLSSWYSIGSEVSLANLFMDAEINADLGLSGWAIDLDETNFGLLVAATDLSDMFNGAMINVDIGISNWDVRNVINMSGMFNSAIVNVDIDLSGWDVSGIVLSDNYNGFSEAVTGAGTLTPPNFG